MKVGVEISAPSKSHQHCHEVKGLNRCLGTEPSPLWPHWAGSTWPPVKPLTFGWGVIRSAHRNEPKSRGSSPMSWNFFSNLKRREGIGKLLRLDPLNFKRIMAKPDWILARIIYNTYGTVEQSIPVIFLIFKVMQIKK